MREGDQFVGVGSPVACECGRSGCAEVIALPWCVYRQAPSPDKQQASRLSRGRRLGAMARRATRGRKG
jgi:hypothetical protein